VVAPVLEARAGLQNRRQQPLPVFVKLAPDFLDQDLQKVLEALKRSAADGCDFDEYNHSARGIERSTPSGGWRLVWRAFVDAIRALLTGCRGSFGRSLTCDLCWRSDVWG
jgi:hypothetical protein